MKNFIISLLNNNEKRRKHITEQFERNNIEFEFFDAIDKSRINIANELGITFDNPNLSMGEKGCFLSHIILWKKIIDENIPVAGIFEDDIYLSSESGSYLNDYNWVDSEIDIIKIEKSSKKVKTSIFPVKNLGKNENIYILKSKNLGTAGYIITNKGANYLFNKIINTPLKNPIDHEIFNDFLLNKDYIACQSIPALCIQDFIFNNNDKNFPSVLESDRIHRVIESQHIHNNKLSREFNRVKSQFIDFIFNRKIERKITFNKD
ncbi:glycosyltransferase family 25 protein [Photorhabdus heterorhabditis]|uniref:glycosyltransferase family 25 protein n=1 Tax=Photorhabdus heterorhabditis TaxID=880156 RepID=UPI001562269C|nr:glycosyltransferase family 25 protein [Photorhabdus heterorhabditis]NRN30798.1 glycosyltransferase family 25 protein [Photorhabdus heterorhabditis subsp. aluminescens]